MPWTSTLAAPAGPTDSRLDLTVPMGSQRGSNYAVVDVGASLEIVRVTGVGTSALFVERGVMGTEAVPHDAGAAVSRYIAPTASAVGGHPDLATHAALGLAPAADVAVHLAAADPHVAYALDADLANHETAGHAHNHDAAYAPTHGHPYAATSHAHVDGDLPAGLARDTEVTSAIETHAATPHGGSLPAGLIVMWGGLIANIPSGWALCNGQNGTPDLRDRFIKGASSEPGGTGGAATHGHAGHTDHAALTHSGAAVTDHAVTQPTAAGEAAHTHTYTQTVNHVHVQTVNSATTGGLSGYAPDTSSNTPAVSGYSTQNPTGGVASGTTAAGASHTHTLSGAAVSAHTVTQPSQHAAQGHSAHDSVNSEPAYYALAFIQKL